MANQPDLVIRNGTVIDGSGGAPFVADVAISGGRITAVCKGALCVDHSRRRTLVLSDNSKALWPIVRRAVTSNVWER